MKEEKISKKSKKYLDELLGESKDTPKASTNHNSSEPTNGEDMDIEDNVYSVYILQRVVQETKRVCKIADPNEAIGILLGYKYQYNGKKYVKVVDWVTGRAYQSHASAEFTPEGVRQYTSVIDEKYGDSENRPKIIGIFHSHPFGSNPHFSSIDYNTFLNFPYDAEYNVFVLIDPRSNYYKSYIVIKEGSGSKDLEEVDWVEYTTR